jgi:Flp pilus assembly protein TadG
MRFRDDESGQMLVLTALCMTMLMGFLALAIDVGVLFRSKRNVQIAADAGAIAGALQAQYGGTPTPACHSGISGVQCAVQNAVVANGVPAGDVTVVNTNPTSGYHTGPGYVEAVVSVANPTFFISAFRGRQTPLKVTARAVAGLAPSTTCMYVLDPTDADALNVQGSVNAPGCGIQVNSNNAGASCDQGQTLAVPFLHVAGGQDGGGGCTPTNSTQVVTGVAPSGDPLNNLLGVNATTVCTPLNTLTLGVGNLINAATRIPSSLLRLGNLSVNVSCFGDLNVLLSGLNLGAPGVNQLFVFLNGVQLAGTVTINGTVDIAQGVLQQGGAQFSINAPADAADPLDGIAILQPSTNTAQCTTPALPTPCLRVRLIGGSVNGIIYAPTSRVSIQGQGGVGGIVAYQLDVTGPLSLTRNYNLANPSTSPLNKVELVE